jgi:hypothetical protein
MSLFIDNIKILKFMVFIIEKVIIMVVMIINSINGFDDSYHDNNDISSGYNMLIDDESG